MVNANATSVMLMTFWHTMNTLLNSILLRKRKSPLTTEIGLNLDTINAGKRPEINDTMTRTARPPIIVPISGAMTISSLMILSNQPLNANATATPMAIHTAVKTNDSVRYLLTIPADDSPSKRLVAISLARLPVCATVRFI